MDPKPTQNNEASQEEVSTFIKQINLAKSFVSDPDLKEEFIKEVPDISSFVEKLNSINETDLAKKLSEIFNLPLIIDNYQAHNKAFDKITFPGEDKK